MNRRSALPVLALALLSVAFLTAASDSPRNRDKQWKKVEEAIGQGLPQTALERLEPIIEGALRDGAHAEAIRAIGRKVVLMGSIQGNLPEERIVLFEKEIASAPEEMRPVMHAVLANWYWNYFQRNRWRFAQRTATTEALSDDITTWDLPRIFAAIDHQFTIALADAVRLQAIPVETYDALLVKGSMPEQYRPTLYDFLVANALLFYASGEQAGALPQAAFVLSADSAIFAGADDFMAWEVTTPDPDAPIYKAVRLYQQVMHFHRDAGHHDALLDWDLDRLRFGRNLAAGEEKDARYQAALRRFVERHGEHEVAARAYHDLASALRDADQSKEAHDLASHGYDRFPKTPGGLLCYNLARQIEAPDVTITTERVWNSAGPTINVRYRNVTEVHFRLVQRDFMGILERTPDRRNRSHPEQLSHEQRQALLKAKPIREWSEALPATSDFRDREEELPVPPDLEPGFYVLLASHDRAFKDSNNVITHTPIWVSDLALVMRTRYGDPNLEGLVVDALSGEPIANVQVRIWAQHWDRPHEELTPTRTDKDGLFRLQGTDQRNHFVLVQHGDQRLATAGNYSAARHHIHELPMEQTVFFTDRAIYRPGQTIRFKGVSLLSDRENDRYEVIPNRSVTVLFQDVNGDEIDRLQLRSNDYGSFDGHFTAPRDRLMGRMTIRTHKSDGATQVTVEEYKRPTFHVTLDAPKTAPKLNDTVSLSGQASAYTGAAVDGAEVRWRVVREMRFPGWLHWRFRGMVPEQSQEIAHGVSATEADGTFTIDFRALPDAAASESHDPTFHFTVYADITDTAGETRSAERVVRVGYTALNATLTAPNWLVTGKPFELNVHTATLDGEAQRAEGTLTIYRLQQPDNVQRSPLLQVWHPWQRDGTGTDHAAIQEWPLDRPVTTRTISTDPAGRAVESFELEAGAYRAVLETRDRFGKAVRAEHTLRVLDPEARHLSLPIPDLFDAPSWTVEPGDTFTALWGSGYEEARAYVEIEHRGKLLQSYWTDPDSTQIAITQEVTEAMRGGFNLRVTMVRENRAYLHQHRVEVPWSNKNLDIAWERFVSKLEPGQKETWTAVIKGPDAETAVAEMVATLYDQSLDAFLPHHWQNGFHVFRQEHMRLRSQFENTPRRLDHVSGRWTTHQKATHISYRTYPPELIVGLWGYQFMRQRGVEMAFGDAAMPAMAMARSPTDAVPAFDAEVLMESELPAEKLGVPPPETPLPDLDQVAVRSDLNETAFFFPHLVSDENGEVRMTFTMPEALTQWKFLGFAHDHNLRAGLLTGSVVTAKDLMIRPNPPRFLREGDELEFTVRVVNQSPTRQTGTVRLTFTDARTGDPVDAALGNADTEQSFDVPSQESRAFSWRVRVPNGMGFLVYRAVASSGRLSDGEEGYLPVLSRRMLVTESLPLPIRGPADRTFEFAKLLSSGESDTLEHKTLTLQMVSNPSWYAVMALPYLMEFPHACSEQIFNRLYANGLARHIAQSDPRIRRVFDQWKATPALDSPLEKNEDLKAVALEETPWMRQAQNESRARRNVGILFDDNRLNEEIARALLQLSQQQMADGAWPWFPGGPPNDYITLYITTGFGRMRHLGVNIDTAPAVRALSRLDDWIAHMYERIVRDKRKRQNNLNPTIALYLYGRSFFLEDQPIATEHREAMDYFLDQARAHWLQLAHRQSQGHLAIALHRFGDRATAQGIMRSIRERAVTDEELGMFWRDLERSWWWYRAPIETQALMIEAFDEVMNDVEAVEGSKVWLLKQKQTQDWKTTKATADAVYALLLRGDNLLASEALVEVALAGKTVEPQDVEAGTGFYENRFVGAEIEPDMGHVTVRKVDEGVAWGSLHWQYLEDIDKITPHEDTPLRLEKALFIKEHTERGPVLREVNGPIRVGDELVVRVVLRTDRDMEYVHMKDHRGSGTEPVNVLSRYRYQDGLAYYESTRDTASHFFIDYLPKGTYVFEYSVRVQHRGRYHTGMAQIQCMYAPEFNSHSASLELDVR